MDLMNDAQLWTLICKVDPRTVRIPPVIRALAHAIQTAEREACAKVCDAAASALRGAAATGDDKKATSMHMASWLGEEIRRRPGGIDPC